MEARYKLRLLNGALAGRELPLPEGAFTIGTGDSDLLLPLDGGAEAALEVSEGGVALHGGAPCWVEGERLPFGPLPLDVGLDLAGLHCALGAADADLERIQVAPRRLRASARRGAGAAALALALGLGGAAWLWPSPAPPPSPREWLPQALREVPGVSARWLGGDALLLSGNCRDSAKLAALAGRLREAGVRLRQEAVCDDELLRSVRALLAAYGYPEVEVELAAGRRARIDGPVSNDERFAGLARALDGLAGLSGWQLSDRGAEQLARLTARLTEAGVLSGLSIERNGRGWLLSGQLPAERQSRLMEALDALNAGMEPAARLRFVAAASAADARAYLPAALAGIGGNAGAPYLILANGMRLPLGSMAKRGMKVVGISPSGATLSGGQRLLFLPLNP
ncbi:type III secretion system inner membrane ring subunit SctD [Chromobacterium phragmitis]|uniref:EscD/YscD/HrpQ family type III secretion system inner membrane ring protein n=1 Tax=Chromobacterium phragmitis TaxID=2202141 RepID=A0A344UKY9_9NEIS|nr:type III secretion system inner membrane ring subunit SctD [Chromobacterium phragmitis]AXE35937.1 EscD/YscD/HrpQ family type III secretion system inner membrane ring protein [Chromobacterium phragmitis]